MNRLKHTQKKPKDIPEHIKVDLNASQDVLCDKCDGKYFNQAFVMKRVSAIQSSSGKPEYLAFVRFVCHNCGAELIFPSDVSSQIKILA